MRSIVTFRAELTPLKGWCDGLQVAFPTLARHQCYVDVRLHSSVDGAYARMTVDMHYLSVFTQPEIFRFSEGTGYSECQ